MLNLSDAPPTQTLEPVKITQEQAETSFVAFAEGILGIELYQWQANVLESFDYASEELVQTTLATPNGAGKGAIIITSLVLGWLTLYPQGRVILTSADARQIDEQVMRAIEQHRAKFPTWTFLARSITRPEGGFFHAFTTADAGRAEGWHKLNDVTGPLLMIVDEAKTVDEDIFSAVDRCTYNALLLASTPGKMSGTFYDSQHRPEMGFNRFRVGLKDCPHITQDKIDRIISKYGASSPFTRSALHGEFLESWDGKPVYYAYDQDIHEGEDLPWPIGAYLCRGHDVGTHAASVWSAYWQENGVEYWHDLFEFYADGFDTDRHAREVIRITENEFPFWNDRQTCAGVIDAIDPAAANSSYTRTINVNGKNVAESALNIFRTYGIMPVYRTRARGLIETIGIVNRLFEKRDHKGRPVHQVDRKSCPRLVRGFRGGYRWPKDDDKSANKDIPLKGLACDNLDHGCDSHRYNCINNLRLLNAESERAKKPLPFSRVPRLNINPLRRI